MAITAKTKLQVLCSWLLLGTVSCSTQHKKDSVYWESPSNEVSSNKDFKTNFLSLVVAPSYPINQAPESVVRVATRILATNPSMVGSEIMQGVVLDLSTGGLFTPGTAGMSPTAEKIVRSVGAHISQEDNIHLLVVVHTDNSGTPAQNRMLSAQRAAGIKLLLGKEGVPEERVLTRGQGDKEPLYSNDTPEGREKNRRVEFVLYLRPKARF